MKTIFDQITDKLRSIITEHKKMIEGLEWELERMRMRDNTVHEMDLRIVKLKEEIERLEEQNHRLRQELEHKAFQDDF